MLDQWAVVTASLPRGSGSHRQDRFCEHGDASSWGFGGALDHAWPQELVTPVLDVPAGLSGMLGTKNCWPAGGAAGIQTG